MQFHTLNINFKNKLDGGIRRKKSCLLNALLCSSSLPSQSLAQIFYKKQMIAVLMVSPLRDYIFKRPVILSNSSFQITSLFVTYKIQLGISMDIIRGYTRLLSDLQVLQQYSVQLSIQPIPRLIAKTLLLPILHSKQMQFQNPPDRG